MRIYDNELSYGHLIYREEEILNVQNISPIATVHIFLVIFLRFFKHKPVEF